jgi:hypothetical protein
LEDSMALAVVTVPSGGLAVVEVAGGLAVTEATNARGIAVTKLTGGKPGLGATFVSATGGAVVATLDPVSASNATLSNGNLTATHVPSVTGGARAAAFKASGKYYFEFVSQVSAVSSDCLGLLTSTGAINSDASIDAQSVAVFLGGATFLYANGVSASPDFGNRALGDRWGIAVDFGPRLAWFRKNGGLWNMNGSANPVTGIGGVSFAAASYAPWIRFFSNAVANAYTANFGATAYGNAAPSGFDNWPAA